MTKTIPSLSIISKESVSANMSISVISEPRPPKLPKKKLSFNNQKSLSKDLDSSKEMTEGNGYITFLIFFSMFIMTFNLSNKDSCWEDDFSGDIDWKAFGGKIDTRKIPLQPSTKKPSKKTISPEKDDSNWDDDFDLGDGFVPDKMRRK